MAFPSFRADVEHYSNCVSRSSVAFLAIPNLVDFAQFFIIMSIGLSLGCVVMGFNGGFDEKLSQLRSMEPPNPSYVHSASFFYLLLQ